jgi:hypothetical protein
MCSPDRMIRAIELISASALAWVRALEQVYLLLRRSREVKQTEAISAGQIFVCPRNRISKTARDRKSPTRASKAPRSAKGSTGKQSQHRHRKRSNEIFLFKQNEMGVRTPGTSAPINILPTDNSLRADCTIFRGCKTISPRARFSAIRFSSSSSLSLASALANQRMDDDDSTFMRVIKPNAIGNAAVGSACESEVSVRNDSESNTVGGCDSLERNMDEPTNSGSCVSGGMSIVSQG